MYDDDMIPVDQFETVNGKQCPLATRSSDANGKNMERAVQRGAYRTPGSFRPTQVCGNCKAFDRTKDMIECMEDTSGNLGYCQVYKFVCHDARVCNKWTEGGPITSRSQQTYRDNL